MTMIDAKGRLLVSPLSSRGITAGPPDCKHVEVQTDKDLVILLACQLFCNEITEALQKANKETLPKIRNEIFAGIPPEEIPAILKQAKAIVEKIVWKAKYGVNLLGTVSTNHFTAPKLNNEIFTDSHQYASPNKTKRSWHLDIKDMSPRP